MFYCISKIRFAPGPDHEQDQRQLASLIKKLRSRFPDAFKIDREEVTPCLVIAALGADRSSLSKKIDNIIGFCEDSGFGRVENEEAILEHFDPSQ